MKTGRHFYCNFDNFNKRLDEWVPASRIDLTQDVEWPNPEKAKESKKAATTSKAASKKDVSKKVQKRPLTVTREASETESTDAATARGTPDVGADEKLEYPLDLAATPGIEEDEVDVEGDVAMAHAAAKAEAPESFSREEEIEKLRVGGSMTQNQAEISRIRNIMKIQFGQFDLSPWYFSPYPEEFAQEEVMYICEFCLSYFSDTKSFTRHRHKCTLLHPPGNEIYRDDYVSFYEIDGRRQRAWCRNLCLLSKLFLDHKTLYYDVDPFLFYVMVKRDHKGCHLVGYFSKEKESADGYNVACILTLPQYQRQGFGKLLIQFSYELSKIEGKLGSPEKPLSDLGLMSYRAYWAEEVIDVLIEHQERGDKISMEALGSQLAMTTTDVDHTLKSLKILLYLKGEHKLVLPTALIEGRKVKKEKEKQKEKETGKPKRRIEPARIKWTPPVFTASQRTWGW